MNVYIHISMGPLALRMHARVQSDNLPRLPALILLHVRSAAEKIFHWILTRKSGGLLGILACSSGIIVSMGKFKKNVITYRVDRLLLPRITHQSLFNTRNAVNHNSTILNEQHLP